MLKKQASGAAPFQLGIFAVLSLVLVLRPEAATPAIDAGNMHAAWDRGEIGVLWPPFWFYYYNILSGFGSLSDWTTVYWPQIVIVALALGYCVWKLGELCLQSLSARTRTILQAALSLALTLFPTFTFFALNAEKDTVATMIALVFGVKLLETVLNLELLANPKHCLWLGLLGFGVYAVRNNNIVIVALAFLGLALLATTVKFWERGFWNHWSEPKAKGFKVALVSFAVCALVFEVLVSATPKQHTSVSLQDTMGPEAVMVAAVYNAQSSNPVIQAEGVEIGNSNRAYFEKLRGDPNDPTIMRSAKDWAEVYREPIDRIVSDKARLYIYNPWTFNDVWQFFSHSFSLCTRNFANFSVCLQAFNTYTGSSYNPLQPSFNYFEDGGVLDLGTVLSAKFTAHNNPLSGVASCALYLTKRFIVDNYALHFWLFLLVGAFCIHRKKPQFLIPLAVPLGTWVSLFFFSPVHQVRYYLILVYSVWFLVPIMLGLRKNHSLQRAQLPSQTQDQEA